MKYLFALFLVAFPLAAQQRLDIELDLRNVVDDMVKVRVKPVGVTASPFRYIIPRSVPGTYSKDDYGRFIVNATAVTSSGEALPVKREDHDLVMETTPAFIEYWVRDTWDDAEFKDVFQPSGTNIEKDTNFVINNHAVFGYVDGHKNIPYEITVRKPRGFFGATSLDRREVDDTTDILSAKTYPYLVDNPVMYCVPDTVTFMQNNMKVTIAVYSPNKVVTAKSIDRNLRELASALGKFFGVMPVSHYTFIFYFDQIGRSGGGGMKFGALEHSHSSMYYLVEGRGDMISESIRGTAGHEFLHILVPLNVHSKEVHDFDFADPKMSQHLWMYEGCTEYFSLLSRVQDTLMTEEEFVRDLMRKVRGGKRMLGDRTMSWTDFGRNILTEENQKIYPIVYESGAALAFCLDVRIRELTGLKKDLLSVLLELKEIYGPERPFDDQDLINDFVRLVHPDLRTFFDDHVIGTKPPVYGEYLRSMGYAYKDSVEEKAFQFNSTRFFFKRGLKDAVVLTARSENDFKVVDGDTLVKINDLQITPENKESVMAMTVWMPKSDAPVTLTVRRNGADVVLSAAPREKTVMRYHIARPEESPGAERLAFRKHLLKKEG
ncbi:MAG: hypothetical protein ACKOBV_08915 [Candidatus Kapaibacterium sp.]